MTSKLKRRVLPIYATGEVTLVYHISDEEYRKGIQSLKNGKATDIDDVLVKQLCNMGETVM